ncbi:MAG: hypothetical protein ABID61_04555 [Candidatus Micrarchaeota archaeon]
MIDKFRGQVATQKTSFSYRNLRGQVATEGTSFPASNLRGQVATEFMLYTGVFMFVAIAAFLAVSDIQRTELPYQQNKAVKEAGDGFVSILTLSVKGGEGFSYRYVFPRTIFGIPYTIHLGNLATPRPNIVIEWPGNYGNFSYQYNVPSYNYKFGGCITQGVDPILQSDACSNVIMLNNDGENLTITQ